MKIILDTVTKQAICPPDFFDNIRKINDAAELTGGQTLLTAENYLEKIIADCSKVIINKNDIPAKRRPRGNQARNNNFKGSADGLAIPVIKQ